MHMYIYLNNIYKMRNILSFHKATWRVPWSNTIAYYPLNWDADDYKSTWTLYNWTWHWTESYVTLQSWLKVANFPYDWTALRYITSSCTTAPKTVSFWLKFNDLSDTTTWQDWK